MSKFADIRNIVNGKLVDHTIDESYEDLSEAIFGKRLSETETRKRMYGIKALLDIIDEEGKENLPVEDAVAVNEKILELQKAKQEFYDQRREYNKLVTRDARAEHIEECLVNAANALTETVGRREYRSPLVFDNKASAVIVFTDWHYGCVTQNVWNEYNTEICQKRLDSVVAQAVERIKLHQCGEAQIVVLGDLIHGAIHTSARVASEELVCEQLMQASELLAQAIEEISSHVDRTVVWCVFGNHARTVANKQDNIYDDNMERIIPWWLRQRFKDISRISVGDTNTVPSPGLISFDVQGYTFCATHGDLDRVKTSPRALFTLFGRKYGVPLDYILLGDKHHRESFEEMGITALICDALCGSDEYANNKRLYSTPGQTMLIVRNGVGVDAEYHLKCE